MKNVLITGGAGFIGSHLAEVLLANGNAVTIIDDFSTGRFDNIRKIENRGKLSLITGSITDETLLAKAIEKADLVCHLAATVGVKNVINKPLDTVIYDTIGTSYVLKYASAKGVKVLVASTSEVYGKSTELPFREDSDCVMGPPEVNRWSYACSKLLDEFLAIGYHKDRGLPVVIVRLFNVVGPGQLGCYGMVVPRFFKSAKAGEPIRVYGDGTQVRCFSYVEDVVSIMAGLISNEKAVGQIVNIGTGCGITIKDLAIKIKKLTGSRSKIVFEPYRKYYGSNFQDINNRIPDLTKLKKIYGKFPRTNIDSILKKINDYYRKNPKELAGL